MEVFKFGGASVKDASSVRNVGAILKRFLGDKLIVVVSAMAKSTNKLEEIVEARKNQDFTLYNEFIKELYSFHFQIMGELFQNKDSSIYVETETIFKDLQDRFYQPFPENYSFEYDQVVSLGEVISSKIVAAYLTEIGISSAWVDARQLVRTDNQFQEGNLDWEKTEELIQSKLVES